MCLSLPQRVALSFDFPFYGHYLRQIIIATGGELGNKQELTKQTTSSSNIWTSDTIRQDGRLW